MSRSQKIAKFLRLAVLLGLGPHLVGSAVFGLFTAGPIGILSAPVLAAFGWFFLPVEWIASFIQFLIYTNQNTRFAVMLVVSMFCAALFVMLFAPKDPAEGMKMIAAYAVAGASAAAFSAFILRLEGKE